MKYATLIFRVYFVYGLVFRSNPPELYFAGPTMELFGYHLLVGTGAPPHVYVSNKIKIKTIAIRDRHGWANVETVSNDVIQKILF